MFKKIMTTLLACLILLGCVLPAGAVDYGAELESVPQKVYKQTFADVPENHWAFPYIAEMVDRGILSGYPDGKFYPGNNITRAEFAKIMCLAAGLPVEYVYGSDFDDVGSADWFLPYVETAKYYLSGFTVNGRKMFRPKAMALREDIAVALVKLKGYNTVGADESILQTMFTDWQSISRDARKYVAAALENGLVSGYEDSTFRGQNGVTRAEAATLLWRAYQYGDANKSFEMEGTPVQQPETVNEPPRQQQETAEETPQQDTTEDQTPKAPYVVNTLAQAAVSDTFAYSTYDENDTIYYYDSEEHTVYKLAISSGKRTKLLNVDNLQYQDVEIVERQVEKQIPKTVKKIVEREIEVEVPAEKTEEIPTQPQQTEETAEAVPQQTEETAVTPETSGEPQPAPELAAATYTETQIVTEEIEETIYETVTETVREEVLRGTYKDFEVTCLYYNTADNKLYLIGSYTRYKAENALKEEYRSFGFLFTLSGGKLTMVKEKAPTVNNLEERIDHFDGIIGNFSDGRVVLNFLPYGRYYSGSAIWDMESDICQMLINPLWNLCMIQGNDIIHLDRSKLYRYQFATGASTEISDLDTRNDYIGICHQKAYFWSLVNGKIARADASGKVGYLDGIDTINGVDVLDYKDMPTRNMSYDYYGSRLYATAKEDFVFYDAANSCWRSLKKR